MLHPFGSTAVLLGLGLIWSGDPTGPIRERGRDLVDLLKLPRESGWVQERSEVEPVIIRTVVLLHHAREGQFLWRGMGIADGPHGKME